MMISINMESVHLKSVKFTLLLSHNKPRKSVCESRFEDLR